MLEYANELLVLLSAAAVLVAVFSIFVLRAYRLTGEPWLLSFCLGFALLEVSFLFVILNRLFGETSLLYNRTLWVHQVIQTAGFGLIATTYYVKDRDVPARRLAILTLAYVTALAFALGAYLTLPAPDARAVRSMTDEYLYGAGLALVAYALTKAAQGATRSLGKAALVPAGFAALAVGQISWMYWGVTDVDLAFFIAGSSLPLGLALLTATTLVVWRGR